MAKAGVRRPERERERERLLGTGILFEEPNPVGSRPSLARDFYLKNPTPNGSRPRDLLFDRETEHLCLRQLMHGIGRDPFARA